MSDREIVNKIGERQAVLDHGYVMLIDMVPHPRTNRAVEDSVLTATRVSYSSHSKGVERDNKLITYLVNNRHTSPFEHVVFTFQVRAPLVVVNQWVRHRTQSYNFRSYRYTEADEDLYYIPSYWREQDTVNKQGSKGDGVANPTFSKAVASVIKMCHTTYQALLSQGVAREQARLVLPSYSLYTEFVVTVNLHNLLHFLRLRMDVHAQWEIRQYANALYFGFVKPCAPVVCSAWEKLNYGTEIDNE